MTPVEKDRCAMDIENKVREAILSELERQVADGRLTVRNGEIDPSSMESGTVSVEGEIDLDDVVMSVVGSLAGGP